MKQLVFSDLVDVDNLKMMAKSNYHATGMPIGIVDAQSGQIYVGEGWQKICVEFHRKNKTLRKRCIESDTKIGTNIKKGEPFAYKCQNGLWDIGIPVFCLEQHIVTIFLGQFFYDSELPDRAYFISQARRYGLDVDRYLEALDEVPVFSRSKVDTILEYNKAFAEFLSHITSKTELLRQENDKKYKTLVDKMPALLYSYSPKNGIWPLKD
jgi:ligand-binding sensor protein